MGPTNLLMIESAVTAINRDDQIQIMKNQEPLDLNLVIRTNSQNQILVELSDSPQFILKIWVLVKFMPSPGFPENLEILKPYGLSSITVG